MQPFPPTRVTPPRTVGGGEQRFHRALRTPEFSAVTRIYRSHGTTAVPKTEPMFPHDIGRTLTTDQTGSRYTFGRPKTAPFGSPFSASSFNNSATSFGSTSSSRAELLAERSAAAARAGNPLTSSPPARYSNFSNRIGSSNWSDGSRSYFPFPLSKHSVSFR